MIHDKLKPHKYSSKSVESKSSEKKNILTGWGSDNGNV